MRQPKPETASGGETSLSPQQQKSRRTRQNIVDAAISCLAEKGYQGTRLTDVATRAGVSAGPRQYYFPTRTDLMMAVWQQIMERARARVAALDLDPEDPETAIDLLLQEEFERVQLPEYIADLELKMAIRGDKNLGAKLAPLIDEAALRTDEWWLDLFGRTGRSKSELLSSRYMVTWLLRGLAIDLMAKRDPSLVRRMEDDLRATVRRSLLGDQ